MSKSSIDLFIIAVVLAVVGAIWYFATLTNVISYEYLLVAPPAYPPQQVIVPVAPLVFPPQQEPLPVAPPAYPSQQVIVPV